MRSINTLFTATIIGASVYFLIQTFNFPKGIGNGVPSPSFFPQLVLILVIVFSLLHFVRLFKVEVRPLFSKEERGKIKQLLCFIGSVFVFVLLFGKVPFLPLSVVILSVMGIIFRLSWTKSLITATILSTFVYFVFVKGLHVVL